jgi:hypothetical protein
MSLREDFCRNCSPRPGSGLRSSQARESGKSSVVSVEPSNLILRPDPLEKSVD